MAANSGPRWFSIGLACAAITSGGMGVGPGTRRFCLGMGRRGSTCGIAIAFRSWVVMSALLHLYQRYLSKSALCHCNDMRRITALLPAAEKHMLTLLLRVSHQRGECQIENQCLFSYIVGNRFSCTCRLSAYCQYDSRLHALQFFVCSRNI